jgi:hypothetical protein
MYFDVEQLLNFPKPLALHIVIELLFTHMPKTTHLDHPNKLLLSHHIKLRLVALAHDQTIKNMMKEYKKSFIN